MKTPPLVVALAIIGKVLGQGLDRGNGCLEGDTCCPQYHWTHMGRNSFDPSGPLLQPDGTWHVFPNSGGWGHCTSPDLLHWNCSHPATGFDGDTGSISVTPQGTFALWPGVGNATGQIFRAVPGGADLDTWTTTGDVVHGART